jgi:hypothetical protein
MLSNSRVPRNKEAGRLWSIGCCIEVLVGPRLLYDDFPAPIHGGTSTFHFPQGEGEGEKLRGLAGGFMGSLDRINAKMAPNL